MSLIHQLWHDFTSLLFPRLCLACEQPLLSEEPFLCLHCELDLPQTDLHHQKQNHLTEKFQGRLTLDVAAALFYFTKAGKAQHLIHQIKYNDKREAAYSLGQQYGKMLIETPHFQAFDTILPVPLHPKKQIKRGYNQAEMFAKGLSESMNISMETRALIKMKMTDSQTKKSKLERLQNVEEVYSLRDPSVLKGKNILIVDDVLTTGATLEACALAILEELPNTKLGFVTIATAQELNRQ
jgi:ComF family protein